MLSRPAKQAGSYLVFNHSVGGSASKCEDVEIETENRESKMAIFVSAGVLCETIYASNFFTFSSFQNVEAWKEGENF